jgi:NAD(P)-dependent dehydrogenase (short-subunit alcohol dehydrogenase family)
MSEFTGKVALVTGATSGIGKATALRFAAAGGRVAAVGRRAGALAELARDGIRPYAADLADEDATRRLVDAVTRDLGGIDVLVNAAGIIAMGSVESTTLAEYDRMMNINVRTVLQTCQLALPSLVPRQGNIVNVSSVTGLRAFPGILAYCVSKAAVDQLTRCMALELAPKGVRVNAVNPGVVRTELHLSSGMTPDAYAGFLERSKTTHPLGRVGTPEEVADLILFLASPRAGWITGATMSIDGGRAQTCARSRTPAGASAGADLSAGPGAALSGPRPGRDRVDRGRLAPALELDVAVGLDSQGAVEAAPGALVDEDRPPEHLRVRFQVGGEVDDVTDARVCHAPLGAGEARDQRAGGDADADPDLDAAPAGLLAAELVHELEHVERRGHRAEPVVRPRQGRAEDRHQPVAQHLIHDAAVGADGVEHERVVAVQQLDRLLRRETLGDPGERPDVGEHDAGLDVLAPERQARGQELLGDLGGGELPDQLALLVAEPLLLEAGAHASPEKDRVHRLEEIVLGAHLDAARDAVHLLHRGHHDDRDVPEARVAAQRLQHLVPVHLGHLDVEQDEVDGTPPEDLQGLPPVLRERHGVAELLEGASEEQPVHPVVVHDQQRAGVRITG